MRSHWPRSAAPLLGQCVHIAQRPVGSSVHDQNARIDKLRMPWATYAFLVEYSVHVKQHLEKGSTSYLASRLFQLVSGGLSQNQIDGPTPWAVEACQDQDTLAVPLSGREDRYQQIVIQVACPCGVSQRFIRDRVASLANNVRCGFPTSSKVCYRCPWRTLGCVQVPGQFGAPPAMRDLEQGDLLPCLAQQGPG